MREQSRRKKEKAGIQKKKIEIVERTKLDFAQNSTQDNIIFLIEKKGSFFLPCNIAQDVITTDCLKG